MITDKKLANLPIDEYCNRVADKTPTPGGGSIVGVLGALASSITLMVSKYAITKGIENIEEIEENIKKLEDVSKEFAELIDEDTECYKKIMDAYKKFRNGEIDEKEKEQMIFDGCAACVHAIKLCEDIVSSLDALMAHEDKIGTLQSDIVSGYSLTHCTMDLASACIFVNMKSIKQLKLYTEMMNAIDVTIRTRCIEKLCDSMHRLMPHQ